jgi:hypothetical protein
LTNALTGDIVKPILVYEIPLLSFRIDAASPDAIGQWSVETPAAG